MAGWKCTQIGCSCGVFQDKSINVYYIIIFPTFSLIALWCRKEFNLEHLLLSTPSSLTTFSVHSGRSFFVRRRLMVWASAPHGVWKLLFTLKANVEIVFGSFPHSWQSRFNIAIILTWSFFPKLPVIVVP